MILMQFSDQCRHSCAPSPPLSAVTLCVHLSLSCCLYCSVAPLLAHAPPNGRPKAGAAGTQPAAGHRRAVGPRAVDPLSPAQARLCHERDGL